MSLILQLDAAGSPAKWVSREKAAVYYTKGLVSWDLGDTTEFILRGGTNARSGLRSSLVIKPIIAVAGRDNIVKDYRGRVDLKAGVRLRRKGGPSHFP